MTDSKLNELKDKAENMFPYAERSQSITQAEMNSKILKLDKQKDMLLLNGQNAIEGVDSALNADDTHDIKNFIMRRVKLEQLK
jgi:hypothetical protein